MRKLKNKLLFNSILMLTLSTSSLYASECSSTYMYDDKHDIISTINNKDYQEKVRISGNLHVRYLEESGKSYTLFWLEKGILEKDKINKNSLYVPFIIQNNTKKDEFLIRELETLSSNDEVQAKLMGLIELLQFKNKAGDYFVKNTMGTVQVQQKSVAKVHNLTRDKQYIKGIVEQNIIYTNSDTNISISNDCHLWKKVNSVQNIKFINSLIESTSIDYQVFILTPSSKKLAKNHWFFELSTNVKEWGFKKKKNLLSLSDAVNIFTKKEQEMLALVDNSKEFEAWIKDNLDFLEHLNEMLETKALDDSVSKKLFSLLSYVNSTETTAILSQITVNQNILEKERFRSLMGLKNTDAKINDILLDEIIENGLDSKKSDFMSESMGMLTGALAKERLERYPDQANKIVNSIIDSIHNQTDKKVALAAAGNMLTMAPDNLVDVVDNMLVNSLEAETRNSSAEALLKIERSNLEVESFENLLLNERDSNIKATLIKASASAKNFASNVDYHDSLVNLSANQTGKNTNRLAALETLQKTSFGIKDNDKQKIRKMMIGEKNVQISRMLKKLYRRK